MDTPDFEVPKGNLEGESSRQLLNFNF
jgi:hypothetical protein